MSRISVAVAVAVCAPALFGTQSAAGQSTILVAQDCTATYSDVGVRIRLPVGAGVVLSRFEWSYNVNPAPIEETVLHGRLFKSTEVLENVDVTFACSSTPFATSTPRTSASDRVLRKLSETMFRRSDHEASFEAPIESVVSGRRVLLWRGGGKDDYDQPFYFQAVLFPDKQGRLAIIGFRLEGATEAKVKKWAPKFTAAIETLRPLAE